MTTLAIDRVATVYNQIRATEGSHVRMWHDIEPHFPYTLPTQALRFTTLAVLIAEVTRSGSEYWSRGAVDFFDARTHEAGKSTDLLNSRFWVESKHFHPTDDREPDGARTYSTAWVSGAPTTPILQIEKIGEFPNLATARWWTTHLARTIRGA